MSTKEPVLLITSSNREKKGFGTGFAVFSENHTIYVVTCAHVVDTVGPDTILVNNKPAELVTSIDEAVDIAVLKVVGLNTSILQIGKIESGIKNTYVKGYSYLDNDRKVLRPLECKLAREISLFTNRYVVAWDLEMTSELPLKLGYSGAPVMDSVSNRVIGLAVMRENGGRKGYALSIGEISNVWPSMPHSLLEQLGQNGVDATTRIPFTNRQEELNRLCYVNDDNRLTLYFVVDAPAGYGKSTLLHEVKERYKDKKWIYALVRMKKDATIEDLAHELCENIELEGEKFSIEKTDGLRQGEQIGGGIVKRLTKKLPEGHGVVFLVDLDDLPNEKLARDLFQDFISDVERALDRLTARKTNRLLKFDSNCKEL
jgi:hypothetical protein